VAAILGVVYGLWLKQSPSKILRINNQSYHLAVAKTVTTQEKGLGSRTSMPINQGMLFVFTDEAIRCFWMKDMRFSLDMVWLSADKKVVYIQSDVSPTTYPESFCPPELAEYVIELNAGQASASNIHISQTLSF
jgi:uncharacterized membrane protein (UPF0127 family)